MRCRACNHLMSDKEIVIDEELCKRCRKTIYIDHDIPDSEIRLIDEDNNNE